MHHTVAICTKNIDIIDGGATESSTSHSQLMMNLNVSLSEFPIADSEIETAGLTYRSMMTFCGLDKLWIARGIRCFAPGTLPFLIFFVVRLFVVLKRPVLP